MSDEPAVPDAQPLGEAKAFVVWSEKELPLSDARGYVLPDGEVPLLELPTSVKAKMGIGPSHALYLSTFLSTVENPLLGAFQAAFVKNTLRTFQGKDAGLFASHPMPLNPDMFYQVALILDDDGNKVLTADAQQIETAISLGVWHIPKAWGRIKGVEIPDSALASARKKDENVPVAAVTPDLKPGKTAPPVAPVERPAGGATPGAAAPSADAPKPKPRPEPTPAAPAPAPAAPSPQAEAPAPAAEEPAAASPSRTPDTESTEAVPAAVAAPDTLSTPADAAAPDFAFVDLETVGDEPGSTEPATTASPEAATAAPEEPAPDPGATPASGEAEAPPVPQEPAPDTLVEAAFEEVGSPLSPHEAMSLLHEEHGEDAPTIEPAPADDAPEEPAPATVLSEAPAPPEEVSAPAASPETQANSDASPVVIVPGVDPIIPELHSLKPPGQAADPLAQFLESAAAVAPVETPSPTPPVPPPGQVPVAPIEPIRVAPPIAEPQRGVPAAASNAPATADRAPAETPESAAPTPEEPRRLRPIEAALRHFKSQHLTEDDAAPATPAEPVPAAPDAPAADAAVPPAEAAPEPAPAPAKPAPAASRPTPAAPAAPVRSAPAPAAPAPLPAPTASRPTPAAPAAPVRTAPAAAAPAPLPAPAKPAATPVAPAAAAKPAASPATPPAAPVKPAGTPAAAATAPARSAAPAPPAGPLTIEISAEDESSPDILSGDADDTESNPEEAEARPHRKPRPAETLSEMMERISRYLKKIAAEQHAELKLMEWGFVLRLQPPGGAVQAASILLSKPDSEGDHFLRIQTVCGEADEKRNVDYLRFNSTSTYGGLFQRTIAGHPCLCMGASQMLATADEEEVAKLVRHVVRLGAKATQLFCSGGAPKAAPKKQKTGA